MGTVFRLVMTVLAAVVAASIIPATAADNNLFDVKRVDDESGYLVNDPYLEKREKEAREAALAAYNPDPDSVTQNLSQEVVMSIHRNGTRRQLARRNIHKGPCRATNPIDRCWRCKRNWHMNRKRLANCALGFAKGTIGGKYGRYYVVTDASDDDLVNPAVGTLRHAVIQDEPLWIIFKHDMIIRLNEELLINSYKTLDGRGANVHIAYGACLTIQFVKHVIVHGLHIHHCMSGSGGMIRDSEAHFGLRTRSDGDGISIFGSSHVWLDHLSMYKCQDGLIDIVQGSTAITISNCHFTKHNEVLLLGASDNYPQDKIMQVTLAFNHFGKGLIQRMPRCRFGYFHVVNNDYTHWGMYAIGGSMNPTIISQGNRYIAPNNPNAKEVTKRETSEDVWRHWNWKSEGDLLKNGAIFRASGRKEKTKYEKALSIAAKPASYVGRLTRYSGTLPCRVKKPC